MENHELKRGQSHHTKEVILNTYTRRGEKAQTGARKGPRARHLACPGRWGPGPRGPALSTFSLSTCSSDPLHPPPTRTMGCSGCSGGRGCSRGGRGCSRGGRGPCDCFPSRCCVPVCCQGRTRGAGRGPQGNLLPQGVTGALSQSWVSRTREHCLLSSEDGNGPVVSLVSHVTPRCCKESPSPAGNPTASEL